MLAFGSEFPLKEKESEITFTPTTGRPQHYTAAPLPGNFDPNGSEVVEAPSSVSISIHLVQNPWGGSFSGPQRQYWCSSGRLRGAEHPSPFAGAFHATTEDFGEAPAALGELGSC